MSLQGFITFAMAQASQPLWPALNRKSDQAALELGADDALWGGFCCGPVIKNCQ